MKTWTFETYISVFVLYIYLSKIFNSLLLLVIRHLIGYCCYFYFRKGFKHLDLSCNQNLVQLLLVVFVRVRSADDLHVGCQPVVGWQEAKIGHPLVSCGFLPHQNNKLNLTYILLPLLPVFALSCRLIVQSSARTSLWLTQVVFVLTDCLSDWHVFLDSVSMCRALIFIFSSSSSNFLYKYPLDRCARLSLWQASVAAAELWLSF